MNLILCSSTQSYFIVRSCYTFEENSNDEQLWSYQKNIPCLRCSDLVSNETFQACQNVSNFENLWCTEVVFPLEQAKSFYQTTAPIV